VRRIYLTASGGPFRDLPADRFASVTVAQALAHPNWKMGERITIGSATLMNKAFEVIEARWLFGFRADQIRVLVHRQSIVHSLVEFVDGSMMAQLGVPDMRVPILHALSHPDRLPFDFAPFDPVRFAALTFEEVDEGRFPALRLGYDALGMESGAGAVLNAADEVATERFLRGEIPFPAITETVSGVLSRLGGRRVGSLGEVYELDREARLEANACLDSICRSH
jgi:1-deoxy-D-xylulose-5-phosphate reductoisomerase